MAIMDPAEATHFCAGFLPGRTALQSFRSWAKAVPAGKRFSEGTADFEIMRDLSLCETERLLVLASSHYRRAHDGFGEISSAWSYVTLYYGSFFAARALMGLFGCWVTDRNKIMSVQRANPGIQKFESKRYTSPTGAGSHALFWELYYAEMAALSPYLSVAERFAVTTPTAGFDWQSQERNRVNYDSFEAVELGYQFGNGFTSAGFPNSLPGILNTQYKFLETTLKVAGNYAHAFGLNTDALNILCGLPDRRSRVRELVVVQAPRSLGNKAKRKVICG